MSTLFLQAFRTNFDNVYGQLEKIIELCPETIWAKKAGGFLFWQQLYHTFAIIDFFILEPGDAPHQNLFDQDVYRLMREEKNTPSKEDILKVAATMKAAVHKYCDAMTQEN